MSNVQPLSQPQPTTSVLIATRVSPLKPLSPTTPALLATAPTQMISNFGAVNQLPAYTVNALISQQAVNNSKYSSGDKISKGILNVTSGVTFAQLSQPGQSIKPGAGEFIQSFQQAAPTLPIVMAASNVLTTGFGGVGTTANLLKNTKAQLSAVTNSIQQATTTLTNTGILSGKESPTQISGVVMAAATLGTNLVANALKNPASVASAVGGSANAIGNAISSGNFAGGLADKLSTGLSGVSSSLSGIASGALGALSSGVSNFVNGATGGISALIAGTSSILQNAFSVAEKSFGELKSGVPNLLGGVAQIPDIPASSTLTAIRDSKSAQDELAAAEQELVQARKAYAFEESAETYAALRNTEAKISAAQQKLAQTTNKIISGSQSNADQAQTGIFGGVSAQTLQTAANAALSGQLTAPKTSNTGINALPGGLGAFTSQIGTATSNILGSLKTTVSKITSGIPAAAAALLNPAQLAGNLVKNVQQAVGNIAGAASKNISNIVNTVTSTISNSQGALTSIASGAVAGATSLISNISSALSGLGNAPGQIKAALVATNTYAATKTAVNSTLNLALDPKVPVPSFEEINPQFNPDDYQQAQVEAQAELEELLAERETKEYELSGVIDQYLLTLQADLTAKIETLRNEIEELDKQIVLAQASYETLTSNQ